jgi:hypothetical protein
MKAVEHILHQMHRDGRLGDELVDIAASCKTNVVIDAAGQD